MTHLIAPGSRKMSAAAIAVDTGNVRESTIFTIPPLSCVGATFENANERKFSTSPLGLTGRGEFPSEGGANFVFIFFRLYLYMFEGWLAYCSEKCTAVPLVYAQKRLEI